MIAEIMRKPEIEVQNRFIELECEDSDDDEEDGPEGLTDSEDEEEELECKVCGERER